MAWKIPEKYRTAQRKFGIKGEPFGAFQIPSPDRSRITKTDLMVIATCGMEGAEWEHVSVRAVKNFNGKIKNMLPTWDEMCFIK